MAARPEKDVSGTGAPENDVPGKHPTPADEPAEAGRLPKGHDRLGSIFAQKQEADEPAPHEAGPIVPDVPLATPAFEDDVSDHDEVGETEAEKPPLEDDVLPGHAPDFSAPSGEEVAHTTSPAHPVAEPDEAAPVPGLAASAPSTHEPHAVRSPATEPDRKVIGSYTVGPNSYTMYADGSVEALTGTGLYSFASLDELRAFIETGGKSPPGGR